MFLKKLRLWKLQFTTSYLAFPFEDSYSLKKNHVALYLFNLCSVFLTRKRISSVIVKYLWESLDLNNICYTGAKFGPFVHSPVFEPYFSVSSLDLNILNVLSPICSAAIFSISNLLMSPFLVSSAHLNTSGRSIHCARAFYVDVHEGALTLLCDKIFNSWIILSFAFVETLRLYVQPIIEDLISNSVMKQSWYI